MTEFATRSDVKRIERKMDRLLRLLEPSHSVTTDLKQIEVKGGSKVEFLRKRYKDQNNKGGSND